MGTLAGGGRHTFYMALKPETTGSASSTLAVFTNDNGTEERAQCCAKDMLSSSCAESTQLVTSTETMKTGRMVWGNDAPTSGPWQNKLPAVHTDLIVAATNQFSGTSLNGHENSAYCDKFFADHTSAVDSTNPGTTVFKTQGAFTSGNKCTYIYTLSSAAGTTHAPGFKLSSVGTGEAAGWMNFQLHFVEWSENACGTSTSCIIKMGNENNNKYYGDYTTGPNAPLFVPSPLKYSCTTASCHSGATTAAPVTPGTYDYGNSNNKAWDGANMNYFEDISNIVPGSIGPIGYYTNSTGPWQGSTNAKQTYDSGILMEEWNRFRALYADYETRKNTYDTAKTDYNTKNAAQINLHTAGWTTTLFAAPVTIPTRPCKPSQPAAYTGPDIQFTNDWTSITGSASERQTGQGTVTLTANGDDTQSSWLMASTKIDATR